MNEGKKNSIIIHPDGSETHFYPGGKEAKDIQKPITEKELLGLVKKFPLPFTPKSLEIIGFGGYSVALRIKLHDNKSVVGVLRYQDTELPDVPTNKRLLSFYDGYTLDEMPVVIGDGEGNKLTFKFVPEIKGATLKDISLLYLLSNKKLLRQFADFCTKTINLFKEEKILPDLVGHSQRGLSYFPFFTSNLMVEFGTNELKLVDTDLLSNNIFDNVSYIRKLILLIRVCTISFSGKIANIMASFLEKEADLILCEHEHEQEFVSGFKNVIKILEDKEVDYRVLGSVAVAGNLENTDALHLSGAENKSESPIDAHILIIDRDLKKLKSFFDKKQDYPNVSFSSPLPPVNNSDTIFQRMFPIIDSRFSIDQDTGELVLCHGNLEMIIPKSDLELKRKKYKGVEFNTLDPNVLLGLAITRNGVIGFEDIKKFELLIKHVSAQIPSKYLDFARQIRSQYREGYKKFIGRQWTSIVIKGIFDGSFAKLLK